MNPYLSVFLATIVSYVLGSLWYLLFGKIWRKSLAWTETFHKSYRPTPFELIFAFIGQLIIAIFLFWLFNKLQVSTLKETILYDCIIWGLLILPTLSTNVIFQRRSLNLILIDGGHWLLIILTLGIILNLTK